MCQEAVSRGCFGVAKEALVQLHTALMARAAQEKKEAAAGGAGGAGEEGGGAGGGAGGAGGMLSEGKVLRLLIRCILDDHKQRAGEGDEEEGRRGGVGGG
jgi:hypothetical protein